MAKIFPVTLQTAGTGLWSRERRNVKLTKMAIGYVNDEVDWGELRVMFDRRSWNVDNHGLIYTDDQFIKEFREFLKRNGYASKDVDYTEQGMQGNTFVSLGVNGKFLKSWKKKHGNFNEVQV